MNGSQPKAAFGQRGREIRAPVKPASRAAKSKGASGRLAAQVGLIILLLGVGGALIWILAAITQLDGEVSRAEQRVIKIVNQPITHLRRDGPVAMYSPGWFHPGAITPAFGNVDIRTTRELPYRGHVTSDLNPTEMFVGSELEFNRMTKYFYVDRTLPKKRLSNAEMVEINGLYRIIGHDKKAIFARLMGIVGLALSGIFLGYAFLMAVQRAPMA